jgi:hypothetical protein
MHPEKCAIFPVCGVVDFTTVKAFCIFPIAPITTPTARHAVNKIVYTVFADNEYSLGSELFASRLDEFINSVKEATKEDN